MSLKSLESENISENKLSENETIIDLQLGDVITISNPKNEKLNDQTFIIDYIDKTKMYYIDTISMKVDIFDYNNGQISNRRTLIEISDNMGYPDGMCSDSEDNIWVAFWMGSCVRGFDGKNGKQIAEIKVPAQKVTSCCFAGEKLDKLIITTALGNPDEKVDLEQYPESGFVFATSLGVVGKKTNLFGA
jgi:gluconolactonase